MDIFLDLQGDELEEGEIAASAESDQRSESWMDVREEAEEIAEDEEDYTVQPQKKRKRSRSHRRTAQLDGLGERETSNGSFIEREAHPSFRSSNRMEQKSLPWSNFGTVDPVQSYEKTDHWGGASKKRSVNVPEAQAPARPRIVFKHSRTNGLQEPVAEPDLIRDNRISRTQAGLLGSYTGDKGRLPEGQQKKVCYPNIFVYSIQVMTLFPLCCHGIISQVSICVNGVDLCINLEMCLLFSKSSILAHNYNRFWYTCSANLC